LLPPYAVHAYHHFRSLQLRPDINVSKMLAIHLYPQSCTFGFSHAGQRLHCEAELGMGFLALEFGSSLFNSAAL